MLNISRSFYIACALFKFTILAWIWLTPLTLFSLIFERTYVAPSSNDVQKVVSAEREIHDAFIHGLAASLGRQILFRDLRPSQGSHGESNRLVPALRIRSGGIASSSERNKGDKSSSIVIKTTVNGANVHLLQSQFHFPLVLQFLVQGRARVAASNCVYHAAQSMKIIYLQ